MTDKIPVKNDHFSFLSKMINFRPKIFRENKKNGSKPVENCLFSDQQKYHFKIGFYKKVQREFF